MPKIVWLLVVNSTCVFSNILCIHTHTHARVYVCVFMFCACFLCSEGTSQLQLPCMQQHLDTVKPFPEGKHSGNALDEDSSPFSKNVRYAMIL